MQLLVESKDGNDHSLSGACFDDGQHTITWASQDGCWSPTLELYRAEMNGDVIDAASVVQLTDNGVYEDLSRAGAVRNGRIAFWRAVGHSYAGDSHENFVMDDDGSNVTQLTSNDTNDSHAVLSPVGDFLAWASSPGVGHDIKVIDLISREEYTVLATSNNEYPLDWWYEGMVSVEDDNGVNAELPVLASAVRIYPNPFNPSTTIEYLVTQPGMVSVAIYDVTGSMVRTLVDGPASLGRHEALWSGDNSSGQPVASGVYFVVVATERGKVSRKVVLTK